MHEQGPPSPERLLLTPQSLYDSVAAQLLRAGVWGGDAYHYIGWHNILLPTGDLPDRYRIFDYDSWCSVASPSHNADPVEYRQMLEDSTGILKIKFLKDRHYIKPNIEYTLCKPDQALPDTSIGWLFHPAGGTTPRIPEWPKGELVIVRSDNEGYQLVADPTEDPYLKNLFEALTENQ